MSTVLGAPAGGRRAVVSLGLAAIAAYCGVLAWCMEHVSYDTWAALVIGPFILAVSLPMIRWITRDDDDPMFGLLGAALVVKLLASLLRYFVAFELYGGRADAARYDLVGEQLANQFIAGSLPLRDLIPLATGTEFLERLTATVYAVAGPTRLGGFLLFSWMSWWGLLLCHRAARVGVPELDHRRYAWLLFFLPSLLFWPSGIGKEAWMLLCIGVAAYGAARILARQPLGYVIAAIGLTGAGVARPHVAAVFMAALLVAAVFRRAPGERPLLGPIGRYLGVAILSVGLAFAFSQVVKYFFPTGDVTGFDAVTGVLDTAQDRTAVGGSEIDTSRPNSPIDYPGALVTSLLRPTLFDADRGSAAALAAVETTFVLVLAVVSWRRLRRLPAMMIRRPYVLFAVVYIGVFGFAWSTIGNLGILTRQRVQVWPFVVLLLALPIAPREPRPAGASRSVAAIQP